MDRPRHFDGRSRYDPLPPPPHFAVPNYRPHHHLRPPPPPPPHPFSPHPPPPIHHHHDRDRGPPVDHRRYFPFPDPPPFDHHPPRVPDRLLYHEHRPSPRHRGEPFPRDPWRKREHERDRAPDANRFNLFNQSPYPIRSEWEHDARSPRRDPPYPPADPGRKRPRWDQGPDLDADDDFRRGCQRRVELLDDQPRHAHHVQVHQPRTFGVEPQGHQRCEFTFGVEPQIHQHRQFPFATEPQIRQRRDFPFGAEPLIHGHRDFTFGVDPQLRGHCDFTFGVEQAPPDTSFVAEESTSSPMVSRLDFVPSRGGGGEIPLVLERQQTPPSFRPAARSYSHMEISKDDMSLDDHDYQEKQFVDDHGYQENHSAGNRGKKGLGRGYNKDYMGTPRKQKPSALSRIQSGKSVWERIEERPAFLSPPSPPLPPSPLPNLPPPSFSEEEHPLKIDALDLSYRSNASKSKVISSPSPVAPSSDGKPPNTMNPIAKKKKIKKKAVKTRARVVVPIVPSSKDPALTEGLLKTSVLTRLHQLSGQVDASTEAIGSSGNTATSASPKSFLKTTVKTASVGKSATRNSATKIDITKGACGEDKAVAVNEESRKYAEVFLSEISSQLCQQGPLVAATTEKSSVKQSSRTDNSFEAGYNKDISEVECVVSGKTAVPDCTVPIGSFVGVGEDASLQMCAQTDAVVVASQENIAAKGPFKVLSLVEDSTADPVEQPIAECDVNPVVSDIELTMSSPKKESPVPLFGDETRVVTSVGSVIFSSSVYSLKGKREERKRDEGDELQQLSIRKVTEGLDGRQSESADSCFDSNLKSVDLKPETKDGDLDRTPFGGPKGDDDHDLTLQVRDERDSDYINLRQDHSAVPLIDSMDERTEQPLPSRRSKVDSQIAELSHLVSAGPSHAQLSDSKRISDACYNKNQADLPSMKLFASEEKAVVKSNKSMPLHLPFLGKVQPSSLHQHTKPLNVVQRVAGVEPDRKTSVSSGIPRFVPKVSLAGSTKQTERTSLNARNKTWHRDSTPSASFSQGNLQGTGRISVHKQSPKKLTRPQSSYIRKGNSLIRNSAAEVHPPKQSHDLGVSGRVSRHTTKRSTGVEIKVGRTDSATGSNPPFERPKTPPLPLCTKLTNCTLNLPSDCSHPTSKVQNPETVDETRIGQLEIQALDLLSGTTDSQNLELSKAKRMTYVKHKSNQLVAAPRPESGDSCNHPADNTQMLASFTSRDIYYRRKKHQLVRNAPTSDVQPKQNAISSLDNSNSDDQRNSTVLSMKSSTASLCRRRLDKGRRLDKVLQKTYKHPKFSLVWTLNGENSNKKGVTSSNRWKVLPHLFPWKRTIYRRNYPSNTMMSNKLPLPLISRKLQLTRKRNAIYKVSTDGFSLRKTGVVSIGGTSLKWSKSIEKHSKKVSKEATLAVAEAERNKRERERTTSVGTNVKNGRSLPRERIFRVGSARYKMDSSRRTLIRIPDEQSSCAIGLQSGNNCQASFVPRRLLIGNDEYIRIGNGNQLVRDPKKLIRILASEKVRWSLHTARLRLAKKHQYCQFFTRFGKCNKNGGKCPYIHDPAKIAICTKFLRGLCSNTDCKLTHKVLPERMPDCSYYLQGLCTNINCPYRHVNVNPKASVCEGFLKGYCADGDECDKKHSYVCPIFEATGKCLQGSKCKLHHPKKKSKRRKQPEVQSNNRGRYFGCSFLETGEPLIAVSDKHDSVEKARDVFYLDGHFTDYIPVDIGSNSNVETDIPVDSLQTQWASDLSEMHPDDLDALIKPIRIMKNANLTTPSSGP